MAALLEKAYSWGFVSGRVNVLERGLLTQDFYQSLLAHQHTEDLLRHLQETPLRDAVNAAGAWVDWSAIIDQHFYEQVASLRKDCPDVRLPDLFLLQGDYQNLKRVLTQRAVYPFPHAVLTPELLASIAAGDLIGLPEPYKVLAQDAVGHLEAGRSIAELDTMLDAAYLRHLLESVRALKVPLIAEYFEVHVLVRAAVVLWRSFLAGNSLSAPAAVLLPLNNLTQPIRDLVAAADPKQWAGVIPGKLGEVFNAHVESDDVDAAQRFELAANDYLASIARRGVGQVFGPERVFSYVCELALQAYNLKVVVCGRLSKIEADVLKRRLRKSHA
ncbi:MAG: V-type ATPase subunit [Candidatus Hydrogenedentes bacterium]|nr:V-type ATPase subunit [Candidatus Hydrogenedentota bacterium]